MERLLRYGRFQFIKWHIKTHVSKGNCAYKCKMFPVIHILMTVNEQSQVSDCELNRKASYPLVTVAKLSNFSQFMMTAENYLNDWVLLAANDVETREK